MTERRARIEIIDALRGFSVVLMVLHHLLYDLVKFLDAPEWFFTNPVFNVLHYFFAGLFILLSGISSRFSRSNVKRGLKVIAVAIVISLVTYLMDMPILFGILHLLGFSMLFFGLTKRFWDAIPKAAAAPIYIILIVAGALATAYIPLDSGCIWVFGWTQPDFVSFDYFPILPWLFVFLLGTWAGVYIDRGKLPSWFYEKKVPFFPYIGRRSLLIYILHQPILYAAVMGAGLIWGNN